MHVHQPHQRTKHQPVQHGVLGAVRRRELAHEQRHHGRAEVGRAERQLELPRIRLPPPGVLPPYLFVLEQQRERLQQHERIS
jgi:hypothetical protein